jgi:hypothetical protein
MMDLYCRRVSESGSFGPFWRFPLRTGEELEVLTKIEISNLQPVASTEIKANEKERKKEKSEHVGMG